MPHHSQPLSLVMAEVKLIPPNVVHAELGLVKIVTAILG